MKLPTESILLSSAETDLMLLRTERRNHHASVPVRKEEPLLPGILSISLKKEDNVADN